MMQNVFPIIIIVLSALSSIVYGIKGQVTHGMYWAAATVLNLCVLMMKEG